ncbi:MAG: tRNA (adenine-N1)-methyltransferase [Acidobacteriota bacterium]
MLPGMKWKRPAEVMGCPFREGEPVMMLTPDGKKHVVRLRPGQKFHNPATGHLEHDAVIGRPPGVALPGTQGGVIHCVRPTLEDYILKCLKRTTSIIHPKDLAPLIVRGDLVPGSRVVEAGMGSGAATIFLLRHLEPGGTLYSYERREEFVANALCNLEEFFALYGRPEAGHIVNQVDIYEGILEEDLDLIVLDLPEPHRVLEHAAKALRPGGTLLSWLPTVTQVYKLVRSLDEDPRWTLVDTRELLERSWQVAEEAMRPFHRMVAHTGFLIRARRVAVD